MVEIGNVAKLTKLILISFASIMLLTSSFVGAEAIKTKTKLEISLFFPNLFFPDLNLDLRSDSIKGFLKDVRGNGIENREILIYVNNILMARTSTDSDGCFYFNDWDNTKVKSLVEEAKTQNKAFIPVKIRAVFKGDNDFGRSMGYRNSMIWLFSEGAGAGYPPPELPAYIWTKDGSLQLRVTVDAGGSADLPVTIFPHRNVSLHLVALPCGVHASVVPSIINFNGMGNGVNATIHISTNPTVKAGDYTAGITAGIDMKTAVRYYSPITTLHLTIKPKSTEERIVLSSPSDRYVFPDGQTEVQLKTVHSITLGKSSKGFPYVKIGDSWLEIIKKAVIYRNGYIFSVENEKCEYETKFYGDYYAPDLSNCTLVIKAEKTSNPPTPLIPQTYKKQYTLSDLNGGSWDEGISTERNNENFFIIRFLGYHMGNMNYSSNPPIPIDVQSGFDIVTNYGVANIELGYNQRPIIGYSKEVPIGPLMINFTILDVGNINTHCYTGSCKNVFDMKVETRIAEARAHIPSIILYE